MRNSDIVIILYTYDYKMAANQIIAMCSGPMRL